MHFIQSGQLGIGREPGIENEMAGDLAVSFLPKRNELENLFCLFPFTEIRIGVAKGSPGSVLSQEDQNTGLASAAGSANCSPVSEYAYSRSKNNHSAG